MNLDERPAPNYLQNYLHLKKISTKVQEYRVFQCRICIKIMCFRQHFIRK